MPPLTIHEHTHDGNNSRRVNFKDINQRSLFVYWTIPGIQAATATNYGVIFTSPVNGYIKSITEVHQTLGTNGSPVTLNIEKLTGTQALDAGVEVLQTAFDLKASINVVRTGIISYTTSRSALSIGDRLALKDTGTLTSVANVTVVIEIIY